MKILHVCLANFYIDGYSYQENILPLEHKKMGYDVEILASIETFTDNVNLGYVEPKSYINENNIKVTRLAYSKMIPKFINRKVRKYSGVIDYLEKVKPNVVFFHNLQFHSVREFIKYKKNNPNVMYLADSHSDFSNSARSFFSKNILHKIIYKRNIRLIDKYIIHHYGVLPSRCEFLNKVYNVDKEKISLLIMGAEEEKVVLGYNNRKKTIDKFSLDRFEHVLITGGKIDLNKTQTLNLMELVSEGKLGNNVGLIVFGSVHEKLKEKFERLILSPNIIYIPWADSQKSYDLFSVSDIAIFPGRHSIYWEQAAGVGIPLLVKEWAGTKHTNINGNTLFLENDESITLKEKLDFMIENMEELKSKAKKASKKFLYSTIAKESLSKIKNRELF